MVNGLRQPLRGVNVIALEQAVAMPFCSFMLCELGAEVVKIERPGSGDVIRDWDRVVRGLSSGFVWLNANKRDVVLNLQHPQGQRIAAALVERADVFLENFAPGVVDRLGLGYEAVVKRNPRLVYCSLSGYGQSGPYRDVKAYDLLVQGESGMLLTNGYPDAPAKVGLPITDLIAGSNAALGVVTALIQRERTGTGCFLDVSMLDSAIPWLGYFPHRYWHQDEQPPRSGMRHQYLCPYGPYLASDGRYINLVVASDEHWKRFCRDVVQMPDWLDDPRFATTVNRQANRDLVNEAVERVIATRPCDDWAQRLAKAGLPFGRLRTIGEVVEHPQLKHRSAFTTATSPVGPVPMVPLPLADSTTPRHIPSLGEHTDSILAELGYTTQDIATLRHQGVVA